MGWLTWLLSSRRERIEWLVTLAIATVIMLLLPPLKRVTVNGRQVLEVTLWGWKAPEWVQFVVIGGAFLLLNAIVARIGRRFWPMPDDVEKVYRSADGKAKIGWIPEEPGTSSPMEYTPWVRTPESTAQEFLSAEEPNAMRVLLIGDAADQEHDDFLKAMHDWVEEASEATLRDLMPAAEELTQGRRAPRVDEVVQRLVLAHEARGIPSREEIRALVERRKGEGIELEFADGEDETPMPGPR